MYSTWHVDGFSHLFFAWSNGQITFELAIWWLCRWNIFIDKILQWKVAKVQRILRKRRSLGSPLRSAWPKIHLHFTIPKAMSLHMYLNARLFYLSVCVCVLHRPHFSVIAASALAAFHSSHPAAQNELARLTCNLCYSCHPLVAICGTCKNLSKAEHAKHLAMVLIATQTEQPNGALRAWGKDWESSWWMRNS